MTSFRQQAVCFDGHQVLVEWPEDDFHGALLPELIHFLFGDMPLDVNAIGDTVFRVLHNPEAEQWHLKRDGTELFVGKDLNGLGNVLGGEALFSLIEDNDHGMAIHAGLVSNGGSSVLLPADSGSGKSSVTTWFLNRGWHYHTDELVIVDLESGNLKAFTRPLNIKTQGVAPVAEMLGIDLVSGGCRPSNMVTMIPHRLINQTTSDEIPSLGAIVFPAWSKDMEPRLLPLGGAEAGLELMRSNVIARNLPGHGFASVTRLVRNIPAYRLSYQHFDQLEGLLGNIQSAATG